MCLCSEIRTECCCTGCGPVCVYTVVGENSTLILGWFPDTGWPQVPLTAEEVLSVFRWPSDSSSSLDPPPFPLSSQLLMLYYILYYQDTYLTNLKTLCQCSCTPQQWHALAVSLCRGSVNNLSYVSLSAVQLSVSPTPPRAYSPSVLVQLPVKKLLQHAWKHQASC